MNFIESQSAVLAATAAASLDEQTIDSQELSGAKQFVVGLVGALVVAPFVLIAINAGVYYVIDRTYEARVKALVGQPLPQYKQIDATASAE